MNQVYPIRTPTSDFAENGIGFARYFDFIKAVITIQVVLLITYSIPTLVRCWTGETCVDESDITLADLTSYMNEFCYDVEDNDLYGDYDEIVCKKYHAYKCYVDMAQNNCYSVILDFYVYTNSNILCYSSFLNKVSFGNMAKYLQNDGSFTNWTSSIMLVSVFLALIYWKRRIKMKKTKYQKKKKDDITNYAVVITNLPKDFVSGIRDPENSLNQIVNVALKEAKGSTQGHEADEEEALSEKNAVAEINFLFSYGEYLDFEEKLKSKVISLTKKKGEARAKTLGRIKVLHDELMAAKVTQNAISSSCLQFNGKVVVIFNRKEDKQLFLRTYQDGFLSAFCTCLGLEKSKLKLTFYGKKQNLHVEKAPRPSQVLWKNLSITKNQQIFRMIVIETVLLVLLIISFLIVLILNYIKSFIQEDHVMLNLSQWTSEFTIEDVILIALSVVIAFSVLILNGVLAGVLKGMSKIEAHLTQMDLANSVAMRLYKRQFVNSCLAILAVSIVTFNYFDDAGLTYTMNTIFILNSTIKPALELIGFQYLAKHIKWNSLQKKKEADIEFTQQDLNELASFIGFDVSLKYADILKMVFMSFFYASILPLSVLFNLIGMIFTFWAHKVALTRYCNKTLVLPTNCINVAFNELFKVFLVYGVFPRFALF